MYFFFFMSGSRHFDAFSYMAHLQFNNGGCLTHYESSINIQIYIYCLCESCFPLLFSTRSTFEHIFSRSYRVGTSFFSLSLILMPTRHYLLLKNCVAKLIGMGKIIVELCSAAMLFRVWR